MPISNQKFILGLEKSIPLSPFLSTERLFELVGHNTGNLAFHHAIDRHLGGNLPVVGWHASAGEIDAAGELAVIPCANQVGAHADYGGMGKKFSEMNAKVVAIGLGAQAGTDGVVPAVPEGTQEWVRQMASHAPSANPNIAVRGAFTKKVLDHYGIGDMAVVTGCPTLFINPEPALGQMIKSNYRTPKLVAVASGHQRWRHLARLEASLADMVTACGGAYVAQSPIEMIALGRGEFDKLSEEHAEDCRTYACPSMSKEEFSLWSRQHGQSFFDIPAWMEFYRRFDFVLGTRIHGIMLALQAGVPALCIAHDSRTVELCETMKVPFIYAKQVIKGMSIEDIPDLFKFDADEFDANRMHLAQVYREFLVNNTISSPKLLTGD